MRLIGMLDSPYVRRTAISLEVLGVPFEHIALSVFNNFNEFKNINPVVKAPTLVFDDDEVMMDSSLILQYADRAFSKNNSLWSSDANKLQQEFRVVSLALAACDKSVQIVYEKNLRPQTAQHQPWIERITGQALSAFTCLEQEVKRREYLFAGNLNQATITTVVVWTFAQSMLADTIPASQFPHLAALAQRVEPLAEFRKYPPTGPGVDGTQV